MAHVASLSQLQTPRWASVNGELVPYADVRIHIAAEALTRALSVLEGVKGYWNTAGDSFALRTPRQHFDRLCRSARLMHIPVRLDYDEFLAALAELGEQELVPDRDLWFRPTLYVTEGHWGEGTVADLVITAYSQRQQEPDPMRLAVSTWRRASDDVLPVRIKCSANYVVARTARIEARRLGCDEAILLNGAGRVAEATAACVVIVQNGRLVTPPTSENCLDSITVDVVAAVAGELGLPFERRPVERTQLLAADECALVGTITELTPVSDVDGFSYRTGGVLARVRERYLQLMRREVHLDGVDMVPLVRRADDLRAS